MRTTPTSAKDLPLAERYGFVKIGGGSMPAVHTAEPSKYDSIHSMQKAQKIDALKDPTLNPYLIKDGYDSIAHALHLWTQVGAKAKANNNISFTEQDKVASKFYDTVLGPAYGQAQIAPMNKELWMKQAYAEALNYKIEDAYNNDWVHGLRTGWNSGLASVARAAGRISTLAGSVLDDAVDQWRKNIIPKVFEGQAEAEAGIVRQPWDQQLKTINQQIATAKHEPNLITRGAVYQDAKHQFWADALPTHDGMANKATSFVAEQVAQAPVYAALMLGGEAAGIAGGANLTRLLERSPIGKTATGMLLAGGEGLAYGTATRKQDDPGEAWRDAVGFAVFHGLFNVTGMGLKKLIDVAGDYQGGKLLEALKKRQDALELAKFGNRPATPVEIYDDHKTEVANNLAAAGVAGQRSIYVDALHHVQETEKMGRQQVKEYEHTLLKDDPARWSPVLSSAKFVRSILDEKKLSEIQPGSEDEKYLSSRLAQLITDAGSEMNTRVKGMDEARTESAAKDLKAPSAKHTLQYYVSKVKSQLASNPGAASLVSDQHVMAAAQKLYAADLAKAAEEAENEVGAPTVEKAANVDKRIKNSKPGLKIRSSRIEDAKGTTVRYSIEPDYKVRLKQHAAAARSKGQSLSAYFEDLSDDEFEKDLSQHFYPKALQKAGVFFENQNTREGMQNPNFLAFMYNYNHTMPKEFAEELKSRLIDTLKVQKYMNGRNPTEPQLAYYAKAMYNHMDNFLGSGRWPKESNLFRTSNEKMFKTTQWQRELLIEKTLQEQKNLKDAFSGDKKASALALRTHAELSKLRLQEFDQATLKRKSQDVIKGFDDQIAELITQTGAYERWDF